MPGDFAPITPAGRMFFIVFAFAAVPVVTNFVLSTVSGVLTEIADRVGESAREKRAPEESELKLYHSHAYNIHQSMKRLSRQTSDRKYPLDDKDERAMAGLVIGLAIRLEAQARAMLIESLEVGSQSQLLLRADLSLQRRMTRELQAKLNKRDPSPEQMLAFAIAEDQEIEKEKIDEKVNCPFTYPEDVVCGEDKLEEVRKYRQTFAALLAASSQLLKLEGDERLLFQRRLERDEDFDQGGILLGAYRKGPAEKALNVDV